MAIRKLRQDEWDRVAELIHSSTNEWYEQNLNKSIFPADDPSSCRSFPEVYEALDPGCCLVAEEEETGRLIGSCFYHPRETHMALGIMNARSDSAGKGVARRLLEEIIRRAGDLPVRLVSSAMNLDSYSLYTKAGFVPYEFYQDMYLPSERPTPEAPPGADRVRLATLSDVQAMIRLEDEVSGIRRGKDFEFFIANADGNWGLSVIENDGRIDGFLASSAGMLGPGVMRDESAAIALIYSVLAPKREKQPVFLVPGRFPKLVQTLYSWGARNTELHVGQVRGEAKEVGGVTMPTFMPETG